MVVETQKSQLHSQHINRLHDSSMNARDLTLTPPLPLTPLSSSKFDGALIPEPHPKLWPTNHYLSKVPHRYRYPHFT
jgi:hypothetical protein